MKRWNKKGQFYLLAAIVIIVIITGFAAVSNYTQKQSSVKLYDVKDELGIESGKVLDYGTVQGENILIDGEETNIIDHFTEQYDRYAGEDKEIYFIFGNSEQVTLITYDDVSQGTVGLVTGSGGTTSYEVPGKEIVRQTIIPEGGVVNVIIGDNEYTFELKPGENFYFVISQTIGEEQLVVVS